MAIRSILSLRKDFTGEYPVNEKTSALWRFDDTPTTTEENGVPVMYFKDSTDNNRNIYVRNWNAAISAPIQNIGIKGRGVHINIINPANERVYLLAKNDGSFFQNLGERIAVGGWIRPTTYSVGNNFIPLFSTRNGSGQPLIYISLSQGRPRMMLYNASGELILDQVETLPFPMENGKWYYIGAIVDVSAKRSQFIICRLPGGSADSYTAPPRIFTGSLNTLCTADIVMGMLNDQYWYAGMFDDWFFETNTNLTVESFRMFIVQSARANGADLTSYVDATTPNGGVILRLFDNGTYHTGTDGNLYTMGVDGRVNGDGRVSITSFTTAGVTSIGNIQTSTSDDGINWTPFQQIGVNGELMSPSGNFIRYLVRLATTNPTVTPRLVDIRLFDIPIPEFIPRGYALPIVLDNNGDREAVLENAYDIITLGEINGEETLTFKIPYADDKRAYIDNEKRIQIVNETYRVRTLDDSRETNNDKTTLVYAEAAFYDLGFSVAKFPVTFEHALPEEAMAYALKDTDWKLGNVTVTTRRTWECAERNALAILRIVQDLHGGDLIFDSASRTVHLYRFSGNDTGALFAYQKNLTSIKRTVDTRGIVTRLYAFGADGMTFAEINGGKDYIEDFTFTNEIRVNFLDCSDFTDMSQLLEFAKMRLAEYSRPRVSYVLNAVDLSVLTGYEHEQWSLGDIVTVDDNELGITVKTRIIRREYNHQEPQNTKLELSTKLRELGNTNAKIARLATKIDDTTNTTNRTAQDMRTMVPFNHIRNSRADDGFANWQNSGFEIDTATGASGKASFRVTGAPGVIKSMAQTFKPATRKYYTFSAQMASEYLQLGVDGQVGAEVVFEYEDGSNEKQFIDFSDLKNNSSRYDVKEVIGGVEEAPRNGKMHGRLNAEWKPIPDSVPEAPDDGKVYGRKAAVWTAVPAEAPHDGKQYARQDEKWVPVTDGGIPEAPKDNKTYGRKNAEWTEVIGGNIINVSNAIILTANEMRWVVYDNKSIPLPPPDTFINGSSSNSVVAQGYVFNNENSTSGITRTGYQTVTVPSTLPGNPIITIWYEETQPFNYEVMCMRHDTREVFLLLPTTPTSPLAFSGNTNDISIDFVFTYVGMSTPPVLPPPAPPFGNLTFAYLYVRLIQNNNVFMWVRLRPNAATGNASELSIIPMNFPFVSYSEHLAAYRLITPSGLPPVLTTQTQTPVIAENFSDVDAKIKELGLPNDGDPYK